MKPLADFFQVLTTDEIDILHHQALQLLENPGMRIGNAEILAALRKKGAHVDLQAETVRFPRQLVEETIEMARQDEAIRLAAGHSELDAPSALTFSWHTAYVSRTPEVRVSLGGGCPMYYDHARKTTRYATGDDFLRMVQLAEGIPEIATVGNAVHYLQESDGTAVPPMMVAIKGAATVAKHSSKPGCTSVIDHRQLDYLIEIGTVVRGSDAEYIRRPIFVNINDTETPLRVSHAEAAIILSLAKRGISIFILPMPLVGVTGPVYPVANAVIGVAEILGVWTAAKAINEEVPVEANCAAGSLDPRTGAVGFSAPEAVLVDLAVAQIFRTRYGVRCGVTPGLIDAPIPGSAAVFERMLKGLTCALAGEPSFPVGILAGGRVFSPEQMMLDLDIAHSFHFLTSGIGGDHFAESLQLIREEGIGGMFVNTEHTARNFRECLWIPRIFEHTQSIEVADALRDNPVQRAFERWNQILDETSLYTIDDDRRQVIDQVVARAAAALSQIAGSTE